MKNLNYIHESINAKAGLSFTDCYENPHYLDPKEANRISKLPSLGPDNEVLGWYECIGLADRRTTKAERKSAEHSYRHHYYNESRFSGRKYGEN